MAIVLVVAGFALGVAAQAAHWAGFRVAVGPISLLEFRRSGRTTSTTFGAGLALAAVIAGGLNAAGAAWLRRRSTPG